MNGRGPESGLAKGAIDVSTVANHPTGDIMEIESDGPVIERQLRPTVAPQEFRVPFHRAVQETVGPPDYTQSLPPAA